MLIVGIAFSFRVSERRAAVSKSGNRNVSTGQGVEWGPWFSSVPRVSSELVPIIAVALPVAHAVVANRKLI